MKKQIIFLLMLFTITSESLQAHPGHGNDNPLSPGHYVSNPEHSIPLTLLIALVVILVNWGLSRIEFKRVKK